MHPALKIPGSSPIRRSFLRLGVGSLTISFALSLATAAMPEAPLARTFVNPFRLPDYPKGNDLKNATRYPDRWIKGFQHDYRELADPSVIYEDGKWYLYPSAAMVYVSEDFQNWEYHRMDPPLVGNGYAPTVVKSGDKFLLTGCFAGLWEADHPLGPFRLLGPIRKPDGTSIEATIFDPALFTDDDGQLYLYYMTDHACQGARLDPRNPTQMLTEPIPVFGAGGPDDVWRRYGDYNEDPRRDFFEGPWMIKRGDTYYLTFTSPGTLLSTYAMGAYTSKNPLKGFVAQKNNPFLRKTTGVMPGSGHGSIVRGPHDTYWAFATGIIGNYHVYERRLSLFPVGFDANGEIFALPVRDVPQHAPGVLPHPEKGNEAGWLPVTVRTIATASSFAPGQTGDYAVDDNCRTWWQPAAGDANPALTLDLKTEYQVAGIRILWAEPGLDYSESVLPGPVRYRVLYQIRKEGEWKVAADCSENRTDYLVDYRTFLPVTARRLKLEILGFPKGIDVGVLEFTAFGQPPPK